MTHQPLHPSRALFESTKPVRWLPVCDHYAGTERFLLKAFGIQNQLGPVFDITADCEDGAAVGSEDQHAIMVGQLARNPANKLGRFGVRIHDLTHWHWTRDIELIMRESRGAIAYVTIPKVETLAQVDQVEDIVIREAAGFGVKPPRLHVLIESLEGLACADELAAHPAVDCLSFGLMDFVSSFGGRIGSEALQSPAQFDHPLMRQAVVSISMAANRHGKIASHGVTTDIGNPMQAAYDAGRACSEFGYSRKWSIHPDQIQPIVRALSPSHEQVLQAVLILQAAQEKQWGPIQWDGRLHDRASYRLYWQLLQRAYHAGVVLEPAVCEQFFGDSHEQ